LQLRERKELREFKLRQMPSKKNKNNKWKLKKKQRKSGASEKLSSEKRVNWRSENCKRNKKPLRQRYKKSLMLLNESVWGMKIKKIR